MQLDRQQQGQQAQSDRAAVRLLRSQQLSGRVVIGRQTGWGHCSSKPLRVRGWQVADLIGADPKEIIFTSGATESNNMAIKGVANFYKDRKRHIITTQTERVFCAPPLLACMPQKAVLKELTTTFLGDWLRLFPLHMCMCRP